MMEFEIIIRVGEKSFGGTIKISDAAKNSFTEEEIKKLTKEQIDRLYDKAANLAIEEAMNG